MFLKFYDFNMQISCSSEDIIDWLKFDFEQFSPCDNLQLFEHADFSLHLKLEQPPENELIHHKKRTFFMKHLSGEARGIGDERSVLYHDKVLFYSDFKSEYAVIYSQDKELLYHYGYYFMVALSGHKLDLGGLHRIHSLGISLKDKNIILPMPIGGGKSTLAGLLMEVDDCRLFSEDTPLINHKGNMFPFPMRMKFREMPENISLEGIRKVKDPLLGMKYLVKLSYMGAGKIHKCDEPVEWVIFAEKANIPRPVIRKLMPVLSFIKIFYLLVIGSGCPQRMEMILRFSPSGIGELMIILAGRIKAAFNLWRKSSFLRFRMSSEPALNVKYLIHVLSENEQ